LRAVVHIGTEKTGTTSIQEYLFQNRQLLIEKGYYFIQSAGSKNNRALVSYCMNDTKYDDFFKDRNIYGIEAKNKFRDDFVKGFQLEVQAIPEHVHTVVISSEHFHSRTNTREEVKRVKEFLDSYFSSVKVICYIREQSSACTSLYSTAIKAGTSPSLNDFFKECHLKNIYYNYFEMLENWGQTFGYECLDVSIFETSEFLNFDLIDDFTAKLNPKLVNTLNKDVTVENESLNLMGQVLGKAINKAFKRDDVEAHEIRNKCLGIIYSEFKGKGELPSIDIQTRVFNEFVLSNEKVRQKFFPDRPILFEFKLQNKLPDNIFDSHTMDVLSQMFDAIFKYESNKLPDAYADLFRDAAIKIEDDNLKPAFELMSLAHNIRPTGPFIKEKLESYRHNLNG